MSKLIDLTGQRFGRLVVVGRAGTTKQGQQMWNCVCDCGEQTILRGYQLKSGRTKSCGCLRHVAYKKTHGESGTRLYHIWQGMKKRVHYQKDKNYKFYGGRGITICAEWEESYITFRDWALNHGYTDELTLDRIDGSKGYCPENCRWADMVTQQNNRSINRRITYRGETRTMTEWAHLMGGSATLIRDRIDRLGWSVEKALETPVKGRE